MTTTTSRRNTTTYKTTGGLRARRAGFISVAGALACLVLAPTVAYADQVPAGGGAAFSSRDIDDHVSERKQQMAADSVEFATSRAQHTMSVGHCGHHALHQPPGTSALPVSAWFTPTSC